jgi:hypothetical protein
MMACGCIYMLTKSAHRHISQIKKHPRGCEVPNLLMAFMMANVMRSLVDVSK